MDEHKEICKQGAALLDTELRKPHCGNVTVYAIHSIQDVAGRITLDTPSPEDAPNGFTVVTPGWGVTDWRAVPYEALFTILHNATRSLPILAV